MYRKIFPISYNKKPSGQDRTTAEKNYFAEATRRRRRISQSEILLYTLDASKNRLLDVVTKERLKTIESILRNMKGRTFVLLRLSNES